MKIVNEKDRTGSLKATFKENTAHLVMKREAVSSEADLPLFLQKKMENLVGLHDIKKQLASFYHVLEFNKLRSFYGFSSQTVNPHMIFNGNPGTGKTTVARLVGSLLKEAGVLSVGHVVEITPNDILFEASWGSETRHMREKVKLARGGVLFIDEAHNFMHHSGKNSDYWRNAITVLLQELTAPATKGKPEFSLILAGYEELINKMLVAEPGLNSRLPNRFYFKNYTPSELVEIFEYKAKDQEFQMSAYCHEFLTQSMIEKSMNSSDDFGNARFVENLFTETIKAIANRVSKQDFVSQEDITTITPFDLENALKLKKDTAPEYII